MKSRDLTLYELMMKVVGYMQAEDVKKAREAFGEWIEGVVGNDD